jgi:hypothetical protein
MSTISADPAAPTAPAEQRSVRFAAFRGKVPLPWVTVVVLAVVMAAADGFIITSLQGAVGAIERSQGPFLGWARDTALMIPLFVLAVMWAFTRAHRKHDLRSKALSKPRKVVATALLIVAAGSVVGIGQTTASAAADYRLQSNLLEKTAGLHNHSIGTAAGPIANPDYANSSTWSPEQRQTMALDVKAVGYGAGLVVIANLVLVGWVVALRGGRLNVVATRRRRRSEATVPAASPVTT